MAVFGMNTICQKMAMLSHTLKAFSQVLAFSLQPTQEYKMHQSPKCGLFPTVDKRHLKEGISQEYQAELRSQSFNNMINDICIWLLIATFQGAFIYLVLFGE
jgi:hypothetical protein